MALNNTLALLCNNKSHNSRRNIYGQQLGKVTSLSVQDREIRISRTPASNRNIAAQQQLSRL